MNLKSKSLGRTQAKLRPKQTGRSKQKTLYSCNTLSFLGLFLKCGKLVIKVKIFKRCHPHLPSGSPSTSREQFPDWKYLAGGICIWITKSVRVLFLFLFNHLSSSIYFNLLLCLHFPEYNLSNTHWVAMGFLSVDSVGVAVNLSKHPCEPKNNNVIILMKF